MDNNELIVSQIIKAMEDGELQAYYQPQYNPKRGIIAGAEALVRWVKKDGSIVSPLEFIPQLEKAGQVQMVDWYMAECACRLIQKMGDRAVKLSINFSRNHACDENFVEKLCDLAESYGVERSLLGVEITESDIAIEPERLSDWIRKIYHAGFPVLIDDFGTGMSSLALVKDIPANVIKIDRAFLNDNCQSEKGKIALETVFYYAHRMKLATIVEGVETLEQLYFLNTCDCDYIQGFLFSKPVPEDTFLRLWNEAVPVKVDLRDPIAYKTVFGTFHMLAEAIYKKYPLIIFSNLSKNSYSIRRKENVIDDVIPETGSYDEGIINMKKFLEKRHHAEFDAAFSKESLFAAHDRGEDNVVRVFEQTNEQGERVMVGIEDYFLENKYSNDLFLVTFIHVVPKAKLKLFF
ncbi:EAL domain, c-di-GMP-specific phosphodiesterase class I (or its enzymatically inactive variant) [Lachnospiraceae bacterium XBB1006]|nr:EAL domain, c-di-GMP-specific phosphodiesterase class I (or its enzymatically inactive variant) [Lachnospiraceae bacterium XBB1006]